jgi:hypothetical protein
VLAVSPSTIRFVTSPATARSGARRRALRKLAAFALSLLCALLSSRAHALDVGDENNLASMKVHAFVSQGFILTVGNDYLADDSTNGSFEFSEVGINFTKNLTDRLRVGVQLFAQDLGPSGNYDAKMDWFYLDYRFADWLGLRAGHLKIPYGLHNEVQDVDSARVPVLLPPSVYPLQTREILFAQTGAELYGFARLGAFGALDYRVFGGTVFLDADSLTPPGTPFDIDFQVPYVVGGRLLWETPLVGLRVGGSIQALRIDTTAFIPAMEPLEIKNESMRWVASAEYAVADLMLTAEYSRWKAKQRSSNDMLSAPIDQQSERAYAMATYRLLPWLHPGAYYALHFPDVDEREGRENQQHDVALTLRFDINMHWLVKLEGHYMVGTAGLVNPLRINPPDITTADKHWAAFFAKTTAHF